VDEERAREGSPPESGWLRLEGLDSPLDEPELLARIGHESGEPVEAPMQRPMLEEARGFRSQTSPIQEKGDRGIGGDMEMRTGI
jgi:hypothetical protein